MGSVVLVADETVAAQPDVVYSLFGAWQGAGWVFAADCGVLAVGSAVTLQLPVGGRQAAVDILGPPPPGTRAHGTQPAAMRCSCRSPAAAGPKSDDATCPLDLPCPGQLPHRGLPPAWRLSRILTAKASPLR